MQEIADILGEVLMDSGDTKRLADAMANFRATRGRSLQSLLRVPGFAKLWDAMEEACAFHADFEGLLKEK